MKEVSLQMMLECREKRAVNQQNLIAKYNKPIVSFCMNIAGPIKINYLIERGFSIGLERLVGELYSSKINILEKHTSLEITGPEALLSVDTEETALKDICLKIENQDSLGRLFDLDVISSSGRKLERTSERLCLLCSKPARQCASRRLHSVQELWTKTNVILHDAVLVHDADMISSMAVKALMYEVLTTPKPGLVDRADNGSHHDMDTFTFAGSASVLFTYFNKAYKIGFCTESPEDCFNELREAGKIAESTMFYETNGVNTHKGAIFSLGLVCCAAGFTAMKDLNIFDCCKTMTNGLSVRDFAKNMEKNSTTYCGTNGQKIFKQYGRRGIRGEFEDGLPSVKNIGLPLLEKLLKDGKSFDEAGSNALVALISCVDDTNMITRGGIIAADEAKKQAENLVCSGYLDQSSIEQLDREFTKKNLSPGGAADLLAVCYFLYFLKTKLN